MLEELGLSTEEAKKLLGKHGYNELVAKKENKDLKILIRQITQNPIVYILFLAALLSHYSGEDINFFVILGVIAYVIGVGFYQERKAERAMEALKAMVKPECRVIRDGVLTSILAREVVPGDILVLEMGDSIPADAIILNSQSLKIDEASLTGESIPVNKSNGEEIYAGTIVVYGKSTARVISIGMNTRLGKIAELVQAEEEETPLQKKINKLVKYFALLTLAFIVILLFISFSSPKVNLIELFVIILALTVASVPEGLPLVVTTALAMGMNKLARRNAIIRRISAVEALGSVTVICTDKTGTITKNEMVVQKFFFDGKIFEVTGDGYSPYGHFVYNGKKVENSELGRIKEMMGAAVLCNNSNVEKKNGKWIVVGDPTEGALISLAAKCGIFKKEMDEKYPKLFENFFTSERKFMSTVHKTNKKKIAFAKGAPEIILSRCSYVTKNGKKQKISKEDKIKIERVLDSFSKESLRVIAFAYNDSQEMIDKGDFEKDMTFYGFVGMIDPIREEVFDAVETCKMAGIRVIMISGDNPNTTKAVGIKIGICNENSKVIVGSEIDAMSDDEFQKAIFETNIFARTRPEHKLRIVDVLKKRGEVVAMTGDGVNDAPALKKADIGIAMGIKGTDVSKEASDMVLADDNFATIVEAVKGGRGIFENIQKTTAFIISRNYAEVFLLMITFLLIGPQYVPLVALQILFINMIDEEIPAIVLALDNPRAGIMRAKPRNPSEGILPYYLLILIFGLAIFTAILVYNVFIFTDPIKDLSLARTTAFASIIATVLFNTISFKSLQERISFKEIFSNKMLLVSLFVSALLAILIIYVPFLQEIFHTVSLGPNELMMAVGVGIATTVFLEIGKFLLRLYIKKYANVKR